MSPTRPSHYCGAPTGQAQAPTNRDAQQRGHDGDDAKAEPAHWVDLLLLFDWLRRRARRTFIAFDF